MQRLPPELKGIVVDCLRDDRKALLACAATSNDWVALSRSALFSSQGRFESIPSGDPRIINQRSIQAFVRLLKSPDCTLISTVHCLYLEDPSEGSTVVSDELPALARLRSVQRLSFKSTDFGRLSSRAWRVLTSHFANTVRDLRLDFILFENSVWQISDLVQPFRSLETLSMLHATSRVTPHKRPSSPALHTVNIYGDVTSDVLHWLEILSAPRLHTITFTATPLSRVFPFLKRLPLSLTRLDVLNGIMGRAKSEVSMRDLDLSCHQNLRVLDIGDFTLGAADRALRLIIATHAGGDVHFIPSILARVASSHLEEVRFGLIPGKRPRNGDPPPDFIWNDNDEDHTADEINDILACPQFAKLKAVVVRVPHATPERIEYIRQRLPDCRDREILRVEEIGRREDFPRMAFVIRRSLL
ncbi:hypothetical protein PLICRDRAFT_45865 [Plicaturopsis crispa FD-325 SS-3]|uniref:F-box domain-containing protein n=1 Tax=Plicaturopsis crispa FD-325 SS-3 TaxID=944288 RepID=A0A0C9T585_PLICR|nr:hypothetical protein PLICRDRAFT_45865 [Plicaturopsis crispa FD-325 SS-3]